MLVEFCVPVFNEEQLLRENMERLLQFCRDQNFRLEWRIVILLNGCTDNSLSIAHCLSKEYPEIFYVNRKEGGKGRALSQYWKDSASDILFYMDIDLAVSLKHIPEFLESLKDNDLVVGSRLLPDSKVERSFIRGISSKGYSLVSRLFIKDNIMDKQCGFKAIRTPLLKELSPCIQDNNWFFDTELIAYAYWRGGSIQEVPINWEENRYDRRKSKVKMFRESQRFLRNLIRLKKRLKDQKRRRGPKIDQKK